MGTWLTPGTVWLFVAVIAGGVLTAMLKTAGNYLDDAITRHQLNYEVRRILAARAALRAKRVERANPLLRSVAGKAKKAA